jgi:hypothetical protein
VPRLPALQLTKAQAQRLLSEDFSLFQPGSDHRAESRFLFQFLNSLAQNLYSVRWQLGPLAGSTEPSTMQAARHSL